MKRLLPVLALALAVMATAVAVIDSKHQSRRLFVELQQLGDERDRLEVQWGRLRLEQGAWSTHGRIEKVARESLGLRLPGGEKKIIVTHTHSPEGR